MSFFTQCRQPNVDIELGPVPNPQLPQTWNQHVLSKLRACRTGMHAGSPFKSRGCITKPSRIIMEDYPKGYPRFSALMAGHETFHILRRFSNVRMRLLLIAQDKHAHPRDVESLRKWNKANTCITRQELAFLNHDDDLMCLSAPSDHVISFLQRYATETLLRISGYGRSSISRDQDVHFYSKSWTTMVTLLLVTPLIIIMLMLPITICNQVENINVRLGIMILSTSLFLLLLGLLTRGKMLELTVAAATVNLSITLESFRASAFKRRFYQLKDSSGTSS
ncbi:hypothetical protein FG05_35209 [Fusarium graminearum]|nr:hypothetical protein FG05_35209 [Fusarium graminearum]